MRGPRCDLCGHLDRAVQQVLGVDHHVDYSLLASPVGADPRVQIDDLGGPADADETRERPARPELGTDAQTVEGREEASIFGDDSIVVCQSEGEAASDRGPVDCGDEGFVALSLQLEPGADPEDVELDGLVGHEPYAVLTADLLAVNKVASPCAWPESASQCVRIPPEDQTGPSAATTKAPSPASV